MNHPKTYPSSYEKKTKLQVFNEKVDELERRIVDIVAISTGFADAISNSRKLISIFKFYDKDNSGLIDYTSYYTAMTKFNLLGVNREIEELFSRYDENVTGYMDYKQSVLSIYGLSGAPRLDKDQKSLLVKLKASVVAAGGLSGIYGVSQMLLNMENEVGSVNRFDFEDALKGSNIHIDNIQKLFDAFDKNKTGNISSNDVMSALNANMPFERKALIKDLFSLFEPSSNYTISVMNFSSYFDVSTLSSYDGAGGSLTVDDVINRMIVYGQHDNTVITWIGFLAFFKGISPYFVDDIAFERLVISFTSNNSNSNNYENSNSQADW